MHAIAELAQAEQNEVVAAAYSGAAELRPEYLIPKPFDPRLMMRIAPAVAKAMDSRRRRAADPDLDAYRARLQTFVYASGTTMKPIFNRPGARGEARRLAEARRSACCARCRWWSTRGWRGRR